MKAKGHWVWLVAKERKLGVNDSGVNDEGLGVKAVPRAAAVYDRQLKIPMESHLIFLCFSSFFQASSGRNSTNLH